MVSASVPWSETPSTEGSPAAQRLARPAAAPAGDRPFDAAGFRVFYQVTARRLWAYLYRAGGGDATLADDLAQEAYFRLLRSDFVPRSEDHAKNYLYRIGTNLLRDHFRRVRRRSSAGEVDTEPDAGEGVVGAATSSSEPGRDAHLRRDVGRFFDRLSPKDRRLLWLAHVEEASHREIAEMLGVQESSVRVLVFRARRRLAAMLEEHGLAPQGGTPRRGQE